MKNKSFEELRKEHQTRKEEMEKYLIKTGYYDKDTETLDKCLICGKPSPYPISISTDKRHCYKEGLGQLCIDCCKKSNDRRFE